MNETFFYIIDAVSALANIGMVAMLGVIAVKLSKR